METIYLIVLPLVGLGLIVFALIWGRGLSRRPVEISIAQLGVDLKADLLTLLILLGFGMTGVGVFFWYKQYESRLLALQGELEQVKTKVTNLDDVVQRFKFYDLRLNPIFPDQVDLRKVKVHAYISKPGEGTPQHSAPETDIGYGNDLWVKLGSLNRGDKLRIVVQEGEEKEWASDDMEIPKTSIQMKRVK